MILNENQIKKNRTDGTSRMILDLTKGLDLISMMSDIFMYTEDPVAKDLIKRYEWQLVEAFEDPVNFQKNLHMFYQQTASYIKKNHLYKEFYSFCYFVFSTLMAKKQEREENKSFQNALNCYYNILFQQMNYFAPHPKMVYGLETNGKLLLRNEPFPNLDVILMSLYHNNKRNHSRETVFKKFQKLGYNIHTENDFQFYHFNDQLITNMTLVMAYFINENTLQINPKEHYMVASGFDLPRITVKTEVFKTALREKRYFLPKKGVTGAYKRFREIKEIYFQEVFTENRIILLYKVTATNGKEFCGFYDNRLELFFSPWHSTDAGAKYHRRLENVILESYSYLTTDIDETDHDTKLEKRLYLEQEIPILSAKPLPSVQFGYQEKESAEKKGGKTDKSLRLFDKRQYQEDKVTIYPFVRKLPTGAKASEEAIALAKQYHYVLREGETFVRPFERTTYRKE